MGNRKIIRKPKTQEKTGLSDTTIWRLEKEGKFPKRIKITNKIVGWYDDQIDEWIENPTGWKEGEAA